MVNIFNYVDTFFTSLNKSLTYNDVFIIFIGLFLFTIVCVLISTSKAYEARLIKAIDMFNNYFMDNPQINEDNLVAFNLKMKHKKVPKQLRKQWQQFVLYREEKASHYMSFETCVSNPIKNSSFRRDVNIMTILAWVFAICALVLNTYFAANLNNSPTDVLHKILLCPAIIILLNYLIVIFLDLKHNAIVSDLYQNYQYFEVNIDKATKTLPEYVDYEVLFDRNEIKKGIPILYTYLQKRAEEEQRELERARLKNIEHEKFNFDESGVAGSLVLERAMQEAENYIAERKKLNEDTEQINSEITQEEMAYREITKEYNRQMQISREAFANFKTQLENASSTIESNYIKKQQQQELDRQRNLERDFDTATERHKKILQGFQAELDNVDKFRSDSRKTLEAAMMSEFGTYSLKVYDEAKKAIEEKEKEKYSKLKKQIKDLEEKLHSQNEELETVYSHNQLLNEKLQENNIAIPHTEGYVQHIVQNTEEPEVQEYEEPAEEVEKPVENMVEEYVEETPAEEYVSEEQPEETYEQTEEYAEEPAFEEQPEDENPEESGDEDFGGDEFDFNEDTNEEFNFEENEEDTEDVDYESQDANINNEFIDNVTETEDEFNFDDSEIEDFNFDDVDDDEFEFEFDDDKLDNADDTQEGEGVSAEEFSTNPKEESIKTVQAAEPAKRRGRPRKVETAEVKPVKKGRGRPKKATTEAKAEVKENKKGRGRPRKTEVEEVKPVKKGRGRPKKSETVEVKAVKKGRGRPKKVETEAKAEVKAVKKGRGRPKKTEKTEVVKEVKRGRGRPKKSEVAVATKKGRGRPRKNSSTQDIEDIDAYLKEIDNAIAAENAKFQESKKALDRNARIRRRR